MPVVKYTIYKIQSIRSPIPLSAFLSVGVKNGFSFLNISNTALAYIILSLPRLHSTLQDRPHHLSQISRQNILCFVSWNLLRDLSNFPLVPTQSSKISSISASFNISDTSKHSPSTSFLTDLQFSDEEIPFPSQTPSLPHKIFTSSASNI
jgi:hypothetical protein